jgi:uncharacterized membrane protein
MNWIFAVAGLSYPVLVWVGLVYWSPRGVAAVLVVFIGVRTLVAWRRASTVNAATGVPTVASQGLRLLAPALLVAAVLLFSAVTDDPTGMQLVPVLISAALLASFGVSLLRPPTVVEVIARLQVGELSPAEMRYCRSVTWMWCAFFVFNGVVSATIVAIGTLEAWTLYCGLLSYLLIGLLFVGERIYRAWRFRRYRSSPADTILQRFFPAPAVHEDPRDRRLQNP